MKINIISGTYTDTSPEYRTSYPINLIPVPKQTGLNDGYLKPADGIKRFTETNGKDRGAIVWEDILYRAIGTKLCRVDEDGTITILGEIGGVKDVTFAYSFDRLAVASNENLFYWDKTTFTQVTDPDLLEVIDLIWVDGYFMTTDGEFIVVTELNDPEQVDPLKYGSSEASPDPIKALLKLRNEVYALNRYTVERFNNVGGTGFPFRRVSGGLLEKGTVGTKACCVFLEDIAFVGGGQNEAIGVWLGNNRVKISTREIDQVLAEFTEQELSTILVEARVDESHQFIYVHLADRTLVYDGVSSQQLSIPVWFILSSSINGFVRYRARHITRAYNKWIVGDTNTYNLGYFTDDISTHYGDDVRWEFGTSIIYNEGRGAIFHELELVGLTGAVKGNPQISTSYSLDGIQWSQEKFISVGKKANRMKRLVWRRQGKLNNFRMQRFRGNSQAHISIARLEAILEPLNV